MNILMAIWEYFSDNILTQPAFMIGLIVFIGYILLKQPWYEVLSGTLKAIVGFFILGAGSGGLVRTFRPVIVGLKDRFNVSATIIDPYFGQNAIQQGVEETFGKGFGDAMLLLAIAFVVNLLLVKFNKYTKLRAVFTTGNVQVQQAATAYWLILFALPALRTSNTLTLVVMSLVLGLYWAVGSNLLVKPTQELTEGAGISIAHQQMFGVALFSSLAGKMAERDAKKTNKKDNIWNKKLEDIQFPGWLSIFNDNMVSTSVLMLIFIGGILVVLGKPYLVEAGFMKADKDFFFYILETSLHFAVYLAILQLGVRTFVSELTVSFQGISNKFLHNAVPGVDCAVSFGFGSPNAVTIGFLAGAIGQFLAIGVLFLIKSPVLILAGFIPLFFDNAIIGVYANNKAGLKGAVIFPFISGLLQVFGSALIAGWVGLAAYGGYLGMWDWAVVWPIFTVIMKYLGFFGVGLIVIFLVMLPQLEYKKEKENYFLIVEDYEAYLEKQ